MREMSAAEYRDKMMRLAQTEIPKETKQFLKVETQKLRRRLISQSQVVPVSQRPERKAPPRHLKYHDSFKAGKTYKYNDSLSKRVYNASRHGHFVEHGRPVAKYYIKKHGYKHAPKIGQSKHYAVYRAVEPSFKREFDKDCLSWLDKVVDEGLL